MTFTEALVNSLRSTLPPVTRLGAKSRHLRPPGPFHFGLGPGSNLLSQAKSRLVMICMGKIFVKILLQIRAFQAILRTSIFFQIFDRLFLALALALTFTATLVNSLRSSLLPVTCLGAISGHLRLPGPFHFGLGPGSCLGEVGPSSKPQTGEIYKQVKCTQK